jgi:methionyl-tRNA formyltransferase
MPPSPSNRVPDVFLPSPDRPLRVVVAGYGAMALRVLQGMLAHPTECEVVGVFRWRNRKPRQWWQRLTRWPDALNWQDQDAYQLHRLMRRHSLWDITHCTGLNDPAFIPTVLAKSKVDVVMIVSWGEIIQPSTFAQSPRACQWVNLHPSLLPAHRGPNPYVACIQAGDTQSGVTFHQVTPAIDAGPIWYQQTVPVFDHDTGGSLRERCALAAAEAIPLVLRQLAHPTLLPPVPQDEAQASYFSTAEIEQVTLDFSQSPESLVRQVRARQPWTDCHTYWQSRVPLSVGAARCVPSVIDQSTPWQGAEPGTIVCAKNGQVTVTTRDPARWLLLERVRVYGQLGFWPEWLSRCWVARQLRPVQQLTSSWQRQ